MLESLRNLSSWNIVGSGGNSNVNERRKEEGVV
eukprot:CAMPEP_0114164464 /NCGR_PEP_ID=MMETSP0043_2-20121206/30667_1 /TAXON_ID=464988 /ORGANISM="Hemiselmis andersenii, Strain CCMP644" /LENGTH=32 /DNA_ID= /DNA_START= /DNA_END= /DNA_ORIENTATION=